MEIGYGVYTCETFALVKVVFQTGNIYTGNGLGKPETLLVARPPWSLYRLLQYLLVLIHYCSGLGITLEHTDKNGLKVGKYNLLIKVSIRFK